MIHEKETNKNNLNVNIVGMKNKNLILLTHQKTIVLNQHRVGTTEFIKLNFIQNKTELNFYMKSY